MKKKGFTLIEVLAVVALISIIAGIGLVEVPYKIAKLKVSDCDKMIKSKLEYYKSYAICNNENINVLFDTNSITFNTDVSEIEKIEIDSDLIIHPSYNSLRIQEDGTFDVVGSEFEIKIEKENKQSDLYINRYRIK